MQLREADTVSAMIEYVLTNIKQEASVAQVGVRHTLKAIFN